MKRVKFKFSEYVKFNCDFSDFSDFSDFIDFSDLIVIQLPFPTGIVRLVFAGSK
jgi:hypothetical protein